MPEKRTAGLYWSTVFHACRRAGVALAPSLPIEPRFAAFHLRRKSGERKREGYLLAWLAILIPSCSALCHQRRDARFKDDAASFFAYTGCPPRGCSIFLVAILRRPSPDDDDGEDLDAVRDLDHIYPSRIATSFSWIISASASPESSWISITCKKNSTIALIFREKGNR